MCREGLSEADGYKNKRKPKRLNPPQGVLAGDSKERDGYSNHGEQEVRHWGLVVFRRPRSSNVRCWTRPARAPTRCPLASAS